MSEWSASGWAEEDLLEIYVYGVEAFGRKKAVSYVRDIEHVFELIAENPRMGRIASALGPNIRRHEHGRHVILYEEAADGVHILAVVHASGTRRFRL